MVIFAIMTNPEYLQDNEVVIWVTTSEALKARNADPGYIFEDSIQDMLEIDKVDNELDEVGFSICEIEDRADGISVEYVLWDEDMNEVPRSDDTLAKVRAAFIAAGMVESSDYTKSVNASDDI